MSRLRRSDAGRTRPAEHCRAPSQVADVRSAGAEDKRSTGPVDRDVVDAIAVAVIGADADGTIVLVNPKAEALFGYPAAELLGKPVEVLVPRESRTGHPGQRAAYGANPVGQPMASGRVLSAQRKDGSTFPVEILLGRSDTPTVHYATFVDVSAREAALAGQVARRSALADLGRLGLTAPAQTLFDRAVSTIAENLDVDVVAIYELSRDGCSLGVQASSNSGPSAVQPGGQGTVAGYVLARSGPVMVHELVEAGLFARSSMWAAGIRGGVCLRIDEVGGRAYGLLEAYCRSERLLDIDEMAFVRSVAAIVSGAIDLSQREPLFELSVDVLSVADAEGHIVRVNPACETILGWTPEEFCARPMIEFVHPDDLDATLVAMSELMTGNAEVVDFESRTRTKAGDYRNMLTSIRSSPDGRWSYAVSKDITERRRTEAEAKQAAAENELILESAGEGIVRVAIDGTITYVNATGAEVLGWDSDELIGRDAQRTFRHSRADGTDYPAEERAGLRWRDRDEVVRIVDEVFWRADGTNFPVEYTSAPLRAHGQVIGTVAVFSDVTARRELEAEAQLKRSAEEANLAKSEFLSRMSHELRTPLNAILGFGQLLERSPLAEREHRHAEYVVKGGRHLLALIDEVLEISRIESGSLGLSVEPVLLAQGVQGALELVGSLADQRGIVVDADLSAVGDVYVMADLQRVKQVLLNLLANAVKYNRPSGSIRVSSEVDGGIVVVRVSDTGPGIAAEDLPRLFTPFDRLGAEGSEVEGTGLGLALSRRLAEAMGGTLDATSEVGTGSTFELRLTRCEPEAAPVARAAPQAVRDGPATCRVLYVEDNVSNLELIEEVLVDDGIEIIAAATGRLALDIAPGARADVILLDINLPDMTGEQVLHGLRGCPQTAETPVIVLTADARYATRRRMLELGASAHLTKPIDIDLLKSALANVCLDRAGPRR
jgi:PAS domain S-box-containing protein